MVAIAADGASGLALALALLSLSLLVAAGHLLVVLDGAVSFIHFAIAVVRRGVATVKVLAVHADLDFGATTHQQKTPGKEKKKSEATESVPQSRARRKKSIHCNQDGSRRVGC